MKCFTEYNTIQQVQIPKKKHIFPSHHILYMVLKCSNNMIICTLAESLPLPFECLQRKQTIYIHKDSRPEGTLYQQMYIPEVTYTCKHYKKMGKWCDANEHRKGIFSSHLSLFFDTHRLLTFQDNQKNQLQRSTRDVVRKIPTCRHPQEDPDGCF